MKTDVAEFVAKCLTCQKIKLEHRRPQGEIQLVEIPHWKWDSISMDFVIGLPKTRVGNNVFHVSQLRKNIADPSQIIRPGVVQLGDNLQY